MPEWNGRNRAVYRQAAEETLALSSRVAKGMGIAKFFVMQTPPYAPRPGFAIQQDDHTQGAHGSAVTVIEYADFLDPLCAQAADVIADLHGVYAGDLFYVFRHFPIPELRPCAELAARAGEAAAIQGKFWKMHNLLFINQPNFEPGHLLGYAREIGLDARRFEEDLFRDPMIHDRIQRDIDSGREKKVCLTPTFFINGRIYRGPVDMDALSAAVEEALLRRKKNVA